MKKILLFVCILLTIGTYSQIPATKTLVADETWVVGSGKSSFRVITANDSIAKRIMLLTGITKYTGAQKSDRNGYYWERSFYFYNKSWNSVVNLMNTLNKK